MANIGLGGLLILGETSIKYIDHASNETISQPLDEATVFVAWEQVDGQRWLLADDYGRLFFLMLILDSRNEVESWKIDYLGTTSRASVLVYLGAGITFVGSHQGDSQVIRIKDGSFEVIQTLSNIAPILDFTIMDLGTREGENVTHEFSSGQARIVTGSGAFNDGTLRSVRSGVGMEELGVLGEMEHITDMWSLQVSAKDDFADTLLVTFVDETRVFRFSPDGEVEELEEFLGLTLSESTLLAANLPNGLVLHVTESSACVADRESGMVTASWAPADKLAITSAASNDTTLVVVTGGQVLTVLDANDLKVISQKDFGIDNQISGVTIPPTSSQICIAAFPQSARVATLSIPGLEEVHSKVLGTPGEAFPRSVLLADVLPDSPPALFVSMADGSVMTFSYHVQDHTFSNTNRLILGSEQPTFKKLPRGDGLFNVFATCEHPSLIYGSEGRIIYSAVNAEGASRICHLHTEAFPGAVAVATKRELKIAMVDKERTTQLQTLPMGATVRRVAYAPGDRAFGIGTIKRTLKDNAEVVSSQFVLADEIMFRQLHSYNLRPEELVECVIRTEVVAGRDKDGEVYYKDRFIVGTAYLDEEGEESMRGRILVFDVDEGPRLFLVAEHAVRGACRALAMVGDKLVAALVKTVSSYFSPGPIFASPNSPPGRSFRDRGTPIRHGTTQENRHLPDLDGTYRPIRHREHDRCCGSNEEYLDCRVPKKRPGEGQTGRGGTPFLHCLDDGGNGPGR